VLQDVAVCYNVFRYVSALPMSLGGRLNARKEGGSVQ